MDKPREWWIAKAEGYDSYYEDVEGPDTGLNDNGVNRIHVIEYSAYEDVCKALDQVERKLYDVDMPKEIFELKAKLQIAIEALEGIQKESCAWLSGPDKIEYKQFHDFYARMATSALEKLK